MQLPSTVPVMTLPNATLFPQALLPLYIFEPRYRHMLAEALGTHRMFSVAMQKPGRVRETPLTVAGLGLIRVSVRHGDGTSHLILQGLMRVQLSETVQARPYRVQRIRPLRTPPNDSVVVDALLAKIRDLVSERMELGAPFPFPLVPKAGGAEPFATAEPASDKASFSTKEVLDYLDEIADAEQVADLVSCALLAEASQRQTILETVDLETRLKHLVHFLMAEIQRRRKNEGA